MMLQYNGAPIRLEIDPGTGIHRYHLRIPIEHVSRSFERIIHDHSGLMCQLHVNPVDKPDRLLRAIYLGDGVYRLEIDSRYLPPGDTRKYSIVAKIESKDEDSQAAEIDLCSISFRDLPPIEAALVVDLGNTRSYALIIDNITAADAADGSILVSPLGIRTSMPGARKRDLGVFDSLTGLQSSSTDQGAPSQIAKRFEPLSFVRLGTEAGFIHSMIYNSDVPGRYSLSSPKRYFWEDDRERSGWRTCRQDASWTSNDSKAAPLASVLAGKFVADQAIPVAELPRSGVLMGMVAELLEQAETHLNDFHYQEDNLIKGPRRITQVSILHPAAWSQSQVEEYRDKILRGIREYCNLRKLPEPELHVDCDESTAVMLPYVLGEVIKSGSKGENWIASAGRKPMLPNGHLDHPVVRIAVVDIGGGTSDLVIADVRDTQLGIGVQLDVQRIYQDGINKAGDDFMLAVCEKIVLPAVAKVLVEANTPDAKKLRKQLFDQLFSGDMSGLQSNWRAYLVRSGLFPLAIDVVNSLVNDKSELSLDNPVHALFLHSLANHARSILKDKESVQLLTTNTDELKALALNVGKNELEQIAGQVFSSIARSFGAAVAAFDCDLVLFAGKASEIKPLRKIFLDDIPVPEDRCIMLQEYLLPNNVITQGTIRGLGSGNRISDSKITTVLGASLYALCRKNPTALGVPLALTFKVATGLGESQHWWGIVGGVAARFMNESALFSPETDKQWISYVGPVLLARRRLGIQSQEADVVYQLRLRPSCQSAHGQLVAPATCLLRRIISNDKVWIEIEDAKGRFADNEQLKPEHFEIRHKLLSREHWLDSGVLSAEFVD